MKTIFKKYSFGMVKLFITQCVLGLFGFVLALTALQADSLAITIGIIALSIGFYLFLVYVTTWGFGSKDMPAIEAGRMKRSVSTGLIIGIGANVPNFILATIHAVTLPFAQSNRILSAICGITRIVFLFINGMYTSILSAIKVGDVELNDKWWVFFIIPVPVIIVTTVAYMLGSKEIHFTKLLLPMTPEELEIKRENKMKKK